MKVMTDPSAYDLSDIPLHRAKDGRRHTSFTSKKLPKTELMYPVYKLKCSTVVLASIKCAIINMAKYLM